MARTLRIHIVDGWYHLISQGNGGEDIYGRHKHHRIFFGLLPELPERFGAEILPLCSWTTVTAYCCSAFGEP